MMARPSRRGSRTGSGVRTACMNAFLVLGQFEDFRHGHGRGAGVASGLGEGFPYSF
jgi:hypothetical protein